MNHTKFYGLLLSLVLLASCASNALQTAITTANNVTEVEFDLAQANRLASLPIKCIQTPYPYKAGHVVAGPQDEGSHVDQHPAFYGCFDWHSAVHGHWSLVYLLKSWPELADAKKARRMLSENLSSDNIKTEVDYFSINRYTESFERTYGWAWLLKLQAELLSWDDPQAQQWANNLAPLADLIATKYITYLPKLRYPIRVGEHTNTAFGLSFAHDYATQVGHSELLSAINTTAMAFYENDVDCPIHWEPSGYDFLSPCLEELRLMSKVLSADNYQKWLDGFLPALGSNRFSLQPGEIIDRSDGKLVHLDGLNFARAWSLYPLATNPLVMQVADAHFNNSFNRITDGDYSGEHWLASFALYALQERQKHLDE